jgi:hypothetical protein
MIFIASLSNASWSQDPTFTQFYSNPVYLNPALAGSTGCPRIALNYRNEWPQLTGNYVTYSAAFDTYAKSISGGIGIIALHDQQGQGTIQTSMIGGVYSYNLKVNRKFSLMFGARAAYFQKFLDWDKLTFGDMIDARRGHVFSAVYENGKTLLEEGYRKVSDLALDPIYQQAQTVFIDDRSYEVNPKRIIDQAILVTNIHDLEPNYMRITEAEANHDQKSSL